MTKQRLMFHCARPIVQRMPTRLWVSLVWLLAQLVGPWRALSRREYVSAVLQSCGQGCDFKTRRDFATRQLYQQLRHLDYYLHGGCRQVEIDWSGQPSNNSRFCLVPMDTYGVEQIDALLQAHPSWMVRRRFDGELQALNQPNTPGRPWANHCARLRAQINRAYTIDIQTDPIKLRSALKSPLHILAFQGNLQARQNDSSDRQFLGSTVSMQLGAVRMAQKANIPMRFLRLLPQRWGWTIVVEPAIPADEDSLSSRLQRALTEEPASWTLWQNFLHARQQTKPDCSLAPTAAPQTKSTTPST